jgi:hypothetical protein
MTAAEIDDALENNPSGSDLEIALAIGTSEGDVRKRRAELKKKAASKFLKGAPDQPVAVAVPPSPAQVPASEPAQRYFVRDPESNAQVEVRRVNANPKFVIFERIIPIPPRL